MIFSHDFVTSLHLDKFSLHSFGKICSGKWGNLGITSCIFIEVCLKRKKRIIKFEKNWGLEKKTKVYYNLRLWNIQKLVYSFICTFFGNVMSHIIRYHNKRISVFFTNKDYDHGLRTLNECINQRNLKIWANVAAKICFSRT